MAGLDGSVLTTRAAATTKATGKANTAVWSTGTNGTSIASGIITNTGNTAAITIGNTIETTITDRSDFSKQQFQSELDLAWIFRRCVPAETRRERRSAGNIGKIGVVEQIEHFAPKLQAGVFFKSRLLNQRKVKVAFARG